MNYWITTHYPPHTKDFTGPYYAGVWLREGKQHVGTDLKPGDIVFKYESQSGPSRTVTSADGRETVQKCSRGKMGIVAIMEIRSTLYDQPNSKPDDYIAAPKVWWRYHADAIIKDSKGFVSLADLNTILGYSPAFNFRGFGEDHSGLKSIDKVTFDKIHSVFKQGI